MGQTKVALQVFSYDESGLTRTLDAYADQPAPDWADVEYHACVTPVHNADYSREAYFATVDQAREHEAFEYVETPEGKLSSRNYAHDMAAEDGADIVVAADADAPPLAEDTLETLLVPFEEHGVAATNGRPIAPPTIVGVATNFASSIEDAVRPHLNGQLHAVATEAWSHAGPFSEAVDQTNIREVRLEEEFRFRRRVEQTGRVVDTRARVRNSVRRTECRLGLRNDDFCRRRGKETFHPSRDYR